MNEIVSKHCVKCEYAKDCLTLRAEKGEIEKTIKTAICEKAFDLYLEERGKK